MKSDRGYHILEVMEREETKLEDVQDKLLAQLRKEPVSPADAKAFVEGLKMKTPITCPGEMKNASACRPGFGQPASAPASAPAPAPSKAGP